MVREKSRDLRFIRHESDRVQRHAAEKSRIVAQCRGLHVLLRELRGDEPIHIIEDGCVRRHGWHRRRGLRMLPREIVPQLPVFLLGGRLAALRVERVDPFALRIGKRAPRRWREIHLRVPFSLRRDRGKSSAVLRYSDEQLPDLRPDALAAHEAFDQQHARLAVAAQLGLRLLVAGRQQRHGCDDLVLRLIRHVFEIPALRLLQRRRGEHMAVPRDARAGERAEMHCVFSRREPHDARDADEERRGSIHLHAALIVFVRDAGKREGRLREFIRLHRRQRRPRLVLADRHLLFLRIVRRQVRRLILVLGGELQHLHADHPLRQFLRLHHRGRQRQRLAFHRRLAGRDRLQLRHRTRTRGVRLHPLGRERLAVNGQLVDPAGKLRRRSTAHRAADPHLIIIHHRRDRRRPAHVPHARQRRAIDVTSRTLRLPESVSHRHMLPPFPHGESARRRPPMPGRLARILLIAEKKPHARHATLPAQPQRPVLIVRRKSRRPRPPLAGDHRILPVREMRALHPRFDRHRVAIRKIKLTLRPRILHAQISIPLVVREVRRIILRGKSGELRRPRPRLQQRHLLARIRAQRLVRLIRRAAFLDVVEAPVRHRLVRQQHLAIVQHLRRGQGMRLGKNERRERSGGKVTGRSVHVARRETGTLPYPWPWNNTENGPTLRR